MAIGIFVQFLTPTLALAQTLQGAAAPVNLPQTDRQISKPETLPNRTGSSSDDAVARVRQPRLEPSAPDRQGVRTAEEVAAEPNETDDETLLLSDVIASVYRAYPAIEQARLERPLAEGQLLEANGAYDLKLDGYTLNEPTGFYRNYRQGVGLSRQTWWGGYLSAGYRIGRGDFQPWYKERETDKGGEFKLGWALPLLQGRAIDAQRVYLFQSKLQIQAAEPTIQQAILQVSRDAAVAYWDWVAATATIKATTDLADLARQRREQLKAGVEANKFPEIDLILNQQLVAERQTKVLESQQKLQGTNYKLSLYLRDEYGQPMVPPDEWVPHHFPIVQKLPTADFQSDLDAALDRRPEPRSLQIQIQQVQYDQRLAQNNLLPQVDLITQGSQDAGDPASVANDKSRFLLVVGLEGQVPIQRRKARGKIQQASAKIGQLDQKLRLQRDKIGTELRTANNALSVSAQIIEQAELSLSASLETLSRYRFGFERGKVDLIYINLLEVKSNELSIKLIEAQRNWFVALVDMQFALGLDPLDQALMIDALPPAIRQTE